MRKKLMSAVFALVAMGLIASSRGVFSSLQPSRAQAAAASSVTVTEFPLPNGTGFPDGITAGPDGNVWFAEQDGQSIGRITSSGVITEFPIPTSDSAPEGITAGPDGNLWFVEYYGNNIGRITTSGVATEFPIPSSHSSPFGITAGPDGNIWFTQQDGNNIGRITPSGTITQFPIPPSGSSPQGITAGPDGNLWFTELGGSNIGRITPSGTITQFPIPTSGSYPQGITAGPDGNLWFTESIANKIAKITPSGTVSEFPIPTSNSAPEGITAGPDGNLWFTEVGGNNIGRITTSGGVAEFPIPSSNSGSLAITTGPDGNLWFVEGYVNNIGRVNLGTSTQWLSPVNNFKAQLGGTVDISVQADASQSGSPVDHIKVNGWRSGVNSKKWINICNVSVPDSGTTDHYSCSWNFTNNGYYVVGSTVKLSYEVVYKDGSVSHQPAGVRQGTLTNVKVKYRTNWTGFAVRTSKNQQVYTDVRGSWRVSTTNCGPSEYSQIAFWLGLGGSASNSQLIEQIGIEARCQGDGVAQYFGLYEMLNSSSSGPTQLDPTLYLVKPGDQMQAEVLYVTGATYVLSLYNTTENWNFSTQQQAISSTTGRESAEWIVEAADNGYGVHDLANFGSVTFFNCWTNRKPLVQRTMLDTYIVVSPDRKTQKATLSGLSVDTTGFSVTWLHN